mmetsp:Transcript_24523/g.57713  ORF Transcript_24523/g.57713 Transcript_24523/m.57713 type:complete len:209 (+) Transcript_24523:700-1326(+)
MPCILLAPECELHHGVEGHQAVDQQHKRCDQPVEQIATATHILLHCHVADGTPIDPKGDAENHILDRQRSNSSVSKPGVRPDRARERNCSRRREETCATQKNGIVDEEHQEPPEPRQEGTATIVNQEVVETLRGSDDPAPNLSRPLIHLLPPGGPDGRTRDHWGSQQLHWNPSLGAAHHTNQEDDIVHAVPWVDETRHQAQLQGIGED